MLTFVVIEEDCSIEVLFDNAGAAELAAIVEDLKEGDHEHLFSKSLGGGELDVVDAGNGCKLSPSVIFRRS